MAEDGDGYMFTESMVTRRVWKVRCGKETTCPLFVREERSRSVVKRWVPSKLSVTRVIERRLLPRYCARVMWSAVTGFWKLACHHWPSGFFTKVPVFQLVSRLPSTAL